MSHVRIWVEPNGTVKITTCLLDNAEDVYARLQADGTIHPAATFHDFPDVESARQALPPTKAQRHKWRWNVVAQQVEVDPTVPDPPHPRQAILDQIDAEASFTPAQRALLKRIVRGE